MMRLFITIFAIWGLVVSCGPGEGTGRSTSSGTPNDVTAGGTDKADTAEDSENEENPIDVPTEVAGAFLICTPVGNTEDLVNQYGCGLRNAEKEKLESDIIRDGLNVATVDDANAEVAIENLDRNTDGSPWHVRFTVAADAAPSVVALKGTIEVEGEQYEFRDEEWNQDDPDISAELQSYRDQLSGAAEDAADKADVL